MIARSLLFSLAILMGRVACALAGTVINTNLPAGTVIVNINAQQDGTANYNGDQSLFYSPFSTQGSSALLTLPITAGTYSFTVIDPTDAAVRFPELTPTQLDSLYTAWTYNSPWVTDYMVFDVSAVTDSSVPQLFDGSPDPTGFNDAPSAYADAVTNGYVNKLRAGPTGRDGTVLTTTYTFAADTTLVFAVPDYGLYDNAGGVSVVVAPAAAQPTIAITSPPDDVTLVEGSSLPLAASVTDPSGIASTVQFYLDGNPLTGVINSAPFVASETVNATPGTHTLSAVVTDDEGRQSTSTQTLSVLAANPDAPAPTATLLTPLANRNLLAGTALTLTFAATASDATSLASVSLYADGVLVAAFNGDGSPVSVASVSGDARPIRRDAVASPTGAVFQTAYKLPVLDQFVNIIAVALDALGQTTISKVATVHSTVTSDQPPLVTLAGLASGASVEVGSTNTLTISASDPDAGTSAAARSIHRDASSGSGTLALLEYYLGEISQALGNLPPYSVNFQPPTAGNYVLHAVATDGAGLTTISDPLIVQADAPSTVNLAVGGTGEAVEGGAAGVIVVSRTGDTTLPLTVFYKAKGAPVAGVDYKALPGSVTIPAGAAKAKIKVKPLAGLTGAGTLKLKLQLLAPADGSYEVGISPVKIKLVGE